MNELHAAKHKDLIYDFGMHKGEDTEFYLRKGFRVIAFEANPELVRLCRNRLKGFIDQGQLTVIEGAILNPDSIKAGQKKLYSTRMTIGLTGALFVLIGLNVTRDMGLQTA